MRPTRPIVRLVGLLLTTVVLAAACASDDDGSAADTAAPVTTATTGAADGSAPSEPPPDEEAAAEQVEESQEALAGAECPVDALDGADGPVEIVFWHAMNTELLTTLEALTAEYNSSQDRVVVELVNQNSYNENFDKYRTASAGDRPALVQLEETAVQAMIDSDTALPVQACVDAADYSLDDFVERVVRAFTVGEVLWPMPFNVSNPVLYYDANAFRAAGLDPDDPPETLDELRAAAEALVSSGAATGGLSFDSGPSSGGWIFEQLLAKADVPYVDNDNGRSGLATQGVFDTAAAVEAVQFYADLEADGLATFVGRNEDNSQNFLAFIADEPAAMTINTSAAISSVLAQIPVLAPELELRVAPMPGLSAPDPGGMMVGGAAIWMVADKPDEELAAAWDYLTFLTEPSSQVTWHLGTGYLPVRISAAGSPEVAAAWEENPVFAVPYEQLTTGNETVASAGPVVGPHVQIRQAWADGFESVLLEGLDPETMVANLAATADAAIAEYASRTGR